MWYYISKHNIDDKYNLGAIMAIEWSDKFSIGDEEIDLQHQELFKIVDTFLENANKGLLTDCVKNTATYIDEHFSLEEKYMKTINYHDYIKHIKQHDALLINLNRIRLNIINGTFDIEASKKFFYDWVNYHILVEDVKLLNYMKS
jgi:hemerythrin